MWEALALHAQFHMQQSGRRIQSGHVPMLSDQEGLDRILDPEVWNDD